MLLALLLRRVLRTRRELGRIPTLELVLRDGKLLTMLSLFRLSYLRYSLQVLYTTCEHLPIFKLLDFWIKIVYCRIMTLANLANILTFYVRRELQIYGHGLEW